MLAKLTSKAIVQAQGAPVPTAARGQAGVRPPAPAAALQGWGSRMPGPFLPLSPLACLLSPRHSALLWPSRQHVERVLGCLMESVEERVPRV